jgi:hypothetical protein
MNCYLVQSYRYYEDLLDIEVDIDPVRKIKTAKRRDKVTIRRGCLSLILERARPPPLYKLYFYKRTYII